MKERYKLNFSASFHINDDKSDLMDFKPGDYIELHNVGLVTRSRKENPNAISSTPFPPSIWIALTSMFPFYYTLNHQDESCIFPQKIKEPQAMQEIMKEDYYLVSFVDNRAEKHIIKNKTFCNDIPDLKGVDLLHHFEGQITNELKHFSYCIISINKL